LRWSGNFSATSIVTLTYRASVTETTARPITNVAQIDTVSLGVLTRSATLVANGQAVYLPMLLKN
ncbi:MAG: hypothetical protein HY870_19365, partial [Chloroflexi bacterium]|nr:hypothetical protein [Chloroflexota bacterium]